MKAGVHLGALFDPFWGKRKRFLGKHKKKIMSYPGPNY